MKLSIISKTIRKIYGSDISSDIPSSSSSESNSDVLKLEVMLKKDTKYEHRTLVIRKSSSPQSPTYNKIKKNLNSPQWNLYLISHGDYMYYDVYDINHSFISQLYKNDDKKCVLLFIEAVIQLKLKSIQDKWRMVEFVRANIKNKALSFDGMLVHRPNMRFKTGQHVRILVKGSALCVINIKKNELIVKTSLARQVKTLACVDKELYFSKFPWEKLTNDNLDFWSIRCHNIESVLQNMEKHTKKHNFKYDFIRLVSTVVCTKVC